MFMFNIRNIKLINFFWFPGQLNISQSDIRNYYDPLMQEPPNIYVKFTVFDMFIILFSCEMRWVEDQNL